ncbi:hypothetical protein VCR17J2_340027 [Vibrio coralliirubri]|nr:hypothetical protein VCR17J2_340027 [Vibrio coralliirubri]
MGFFHFAIPVDSSLLDHILNYKGQKRQRPDNLKSYQAL